MGDVGTMIGGTTAPKMWKDLTVEEKLERMRMELKNMQRNEFNRNQEVAQLNKKLVEHDHKDGMVVIPIDRSNYPNHNPLSNSLVPQQLERDQKGEVYF